MKNFFFRRLPLALIAFTAVTALSLFSAAALETPVSGQAGSDSIQAEAGAYAAQAQNSPLTPESAQAGRKVIDLESVQPEPDSVQPKAGFAGPDPEETYAVLESVDSLIRYAAENAIRYTVSAGETVMLEAEDFRRFFDGRAGANDTLRWVAFRTNSSLRSGSGEFQSISSGSIQKRFSRAALEDAAFYDVSPAHGVYPLDELAFVAAERGGGNRVTLEFTAYGQRENYDGVLFIDISSQQTPEEGDIVYDVVPGQTIFFNRDDFSVFYRRQYVGLLRCVVFSAIGDLDGGTLSNFARIFDAPTLHEFRFYYSNSRYGDYLLESLSFTAAADFRGTAALSFRAYGDAADTQEQYAVGTVLIRAAAEDGSPLPARGDSITPTYAPALTPSVTPAPLTPSATSTPAPPLTFTPTPFAASTPAVTSAPALTVTPLPASTITPTPTMIPSSDLRAPSTLIRYSTNYSAPLQFNASDFSRCFRRSYPGGALDTVRFTGVPASGMLFYNYYATSPYGSTSRRQVTEANRASLQFSFSPAETSAYSLAELTFIPAEGLNTCVCLPFSASGRDVGGRPANVNGHVLISSTSVMIADVYGATPKGAAVPFPAAAIENAVTAATGITPSAFRLLELPDRKIGTVRYVNAAPSSMVSTPQDWPPASSEQIYASSEGNYFFGALRFVPEASYTGPVEIPYIALDGNGAAIGAGSLNLGIVSAVKKFSDVTSATWCYKYVTELADAGIVGGYGDSTYRPFEPVTYGAALKLVMLAAGYEPQEQIDENVFSGYLARARKEGIVTRGGVDLSAHITRLQAAEIAAGAMRLKTDSLSSVKPFRDTDSPSVQALSDAGIFNGYFENGVSTFRPEGSVTRGQLAAIVWRMRNYQMTD